jgi:hypothetical protein
MVKSPWKLLTGLLSRGKTADQRHVDQANPIEVLNDAERPRARSNPSEAANEGASEPGQEASAASQAGMIETGDRQETSPTIAADVADGTPSREDPFLTPDRIIGIVGAERRNPQRKALPTIRRKTRAKVPGYTTDAEPDIALAERPGPIEADPVKALDREIRELRSQLTVKLRLQNDQLRQMLKRFGQK